MKLTRLTTLAIAAAALAGTLGAQQRGGNNHSAPRAQAPRAQAPRAQPSRGNYAEGRARPESRPSQYARPDSRAAQYARSSPDVRGRADFGARGVPARSDVRGRDDFRGRDNYRVPVADHGRPLITRAGYRGVAYGGGFRYWRGVDRFGARIALPLGWYRPLYVRGFFPVDYMSYCEAVPYDLNYMLPPMYDGATSCLVGDRIVVYDRFSRGISFVAVIP